MRIKKRSELTLFLAVCLLLSALTPVGGTSAPPETSAEAFVLMEQESRQVLCGSGEDTPLPIASITKIMTGLLTVERCGLEEPVTVQPEWLEVEGSRMGLRAGETYSVEDLLYGLMLASGNDAALALACHMAGNAETFAQWMNRRAAELGMENTRFLNPHGLTQAGHCSSARDMAVLTCAAMENPRFAAVVGTRTAQAGGCQLRNHNRLLWEYPDAIGVKTGYTEAAGRTLVSCARREGMTLVCVTLNDPADWKDHAALLDWGFGEYTPVRTGALCREVPVISGVEAKVRAVPSAKVTVPVRKDAQWEWRIALPPFVYAPCGAGDVIGSAELLIGGERVLSCSLLAEDTAELDGTLRLRFWERLRRAWSLACKGEG